MSNRSNAVTWPMFRGFCLGTVQNSFYDAWNNNGRPKHFGDVNGNSNLRTGYS
jgi:hypothetical protein